MAKETRKQKGTIGRVTHEWKHGELESGRRGRRERCIADDQDAA